jgi:probable HAF family extracellular repeat protein
MVLMSSLAALGCGGCAEERPGGVAAPPAAETALAGAATELPTGASCRAGVIAPVGHATIVEIPSLGGSDVFVQDVNDSGVVVGSERDQAGRFHAFRYTDEGGVRDLGASATAYASSIASDGTIGGHLADGSSSASVYGYRYTATGGIARVCDTPCSIWDVGADGQAVGLINDPADALQWQAFLQSPATGLRRLGTLGGARSSASGLSAAGLVIGNSQVAGSSKSDVGHAFVWDAQNGMRDLNVLAGASGAGWVLQAANDISATAIVGYGTFQGRTRPFLFDLKTSTVKALGGAGDKRDAFGWGVDGSGDAVGWSSLGGGRHEAFIYGANIGFRPLVDFVDSVEGWDLQQASAISDNGIVVGWGYHAGIRRGFKLTLPLCHAGS